MLFPPLEELRELASVLTRGDAAEAPVMDHPARPLRSPGEDVLLHAPRPVRIDPTVALAHVVDHDVRLNPHADGWPRHVGVDVRGQVQARVLPPTPPGHLVQERVVQVAVRAVVRLHRGLTDIAVAVEPAIHDAKGEVVRTALAGHALADLVHRDVGQLLGGQTGVPRLPRRARALVALHLIDLREALVVGLRLEVVDDRVVRPQVRTFRDGLIQPVPTQRVVRPPSTRPCGLGEGRLPEHVEVADHDLGRVRHAPPERVRRIEAHSTDAVQEQAHGSHLADPGVAGRVPGHDHHVVLAANQHRSDVVAHSHAVRVAQVGRAPDGDHVRTCRHPIGLAQAVEGERHGGPAVQGRFGAGLVGVGVL